MTARERLPNRRSSESFDFKWNVVPYGCTYSRFADGRLAEVFLESTKNGSAADIVSRDAAIACSFALQHGADADLIRRALCRDIHGRAIGPLAIALDKIVGLAVLK